MKKMIKVKEINRRLIGILIIVLFLSTTINVSIIQSTASSIKAKNTYSISGTVYKYPTGNIAQGVEVLYYDGYGRSFRDFTDSNGRYLIEFNTDPENNDIDYVVAAKNAKYECALLFVKNLTRPYDLWIATPGSGKIYGYTIYLDDSRVGGMEVKLTYCVQPSVYRNITTISSSNGYYEFTDLYIEPCNNAPMYCYAVNISSQYRYTVHTPA